MTLRNIILQITQKLVNILNIYLRTTQATKDPNTKIVYKKKVERYTDILKECNGVGNNNEIANKLFNFKESIFFFEFEELVKQANFLLIPLCWIKFDTRADIMNVCEILTDDILENINKVKAITKQKNKPKEADFKSTGKFNPVRFRSETPGFFVNNGLIDSVSINEKKIKDIFEKPVNFFIKKNRENSTFYLCALLEFETTLRHPKYFYTMEKADNEFKIIKNSSKEKYKKYNGRESIDTIEIKFDESFSTKTFQMTDLNSNNFSFQFDPAFNTSNFNVKLSFSKNGIDVENKFVSPSTVVCAKDFLILNSKCLKKYQHLEKITNLNHQVSAEQNEIIKQQKEVLSIETRFTALENRIRILPDSTLLLEEVKTVEAEAKKAEEDAGIEKAKDAVNRAEATCQKIRDAMETGKFLKKEIESSILEVGKKLTDVDWLCSKVNNLQTLAQKLQREGEKLQREGEKLQTEAEKSQTDAQQLKIDAVKLKNTAEELQARVIALLTEAKKISVPENFLQEAETLVQKIKNSVKEIEKKKNSEGKGEGKDKDKDKKDKKEGNSLKTIIIITIILCVVVIVIGAIVYFNMNKETKEVEGEAEI